MRVYQILHPDKELDELYTVEYTTGIRGKTFPRGTKIVAMEIYSGIVVDRWTIPLKEDGSPDFKKVRKRRVET